MENLGHGSGFSPPKSMYADNTHDVHLEKLGGTGRDLEDFGKFRKGSTEMQ